MLHPLPKPEKRSVADPEVPNDPEGRDLKGHALIRCRGVRATKQHRGNDGMLHGASRGGLQRLHVLFLGLLLMSGASFSHNLSLSSGLTGGGFFSGNLRGLLLLTGGSFFSVPLLGLLFLPGGSFLYLLRFSFVQPHPQVVGPMGQNRLGMTRAWLMQQFA